MNTQTQEALIKLLDKFELFLMYALVVIGMYSGLRGWVDVGTYSLAYACFIRIGIVK